jgi:hypothetical protein
MDTNRSWHLDLTTKDTPLLIVDNLYDRMNVLGGVRDCTAHRQLLAIRDAYKEEELTAHGDLMQELWSEMPKTMALLDALQEDTDES